MTENLCSCPACGRGSEPSLKSLIESLRSLCTGCRGELLGGFSRMKNEIRELTAKVRELERRQKGLK